MAKWLEVTAYPINRKELINSDHIIGIVPVDNGLQCRIYTSHPDIGGLVKEPYLYIAEQFEVIKNSERLQHG